VWSASLGAEWTVMATSPLHEQEPGAVSGSRSRMLYHQPTVRPKHDGHLEPWGHPQIALERAPLLGGSGSRRDEPGFVSEDDCLDAVAQLQSGEELHYLDAHHGRAEPQLGS
jgi:hypothetical protein